MHQIQNSWPDPREAKSNEEFVYQYTIQMGAAKGAQAVFDYIEFHIERAETLTNKKEGKIVKNFKI